MNIKFLLQTISHIIVRIIVIPLFLIRYEFKLRYKVKLIHYKNGFYSSNHQALVDPPLIGVFAPSTLYFIAKKNLFKNSLFSLFLKILGAIPINRAIFDKNTLYKIIQLIDENRSVLIFPEGTRSGGNRFLKPKAGIGFLTNKSPNSTIVPIKIWNSKFAFDNFIKFKRPKIELVYGRPYCLNKHYNWGSDRKQKYRNISKYILTRIKEV